MNCNEIHPAGELISLRATAGSDSDHRFANTLSSQGQRQTARLHFEQQNDLICGTLAALDRRLEAIRKEQLAKNRASLCQLDSEQLQALEWATTNITRKIFREVADELEHSELEGNGKKLSETVCLMLGLA